MTSILEIIKYSELFKTNVKKEIRGKYKGSFLGILWSFINPLLMVLVYSIVFPYIMKIKTENFLIFLICGVIPWNFFVASLQMGTTTISNNANLIKKVYFPREILPLSVVCSSLINFIISCSIILIFVLLGGLGLSIHLLLFPFIALIQCLFTLSLVFIFSALNVYIKDIEYIVGFLLNIAFYATPVLYPTTLFEGPILWMFRLNPMAHFINAYRDVFYVHQVPNMMNLSIILGLSILFLIISFKVFKKLEKGFAEEI